MSYDDTEHENIAQTIAREIATPHVLLTPPEGEDGITQVALPAGWKLQAVDNEGLLDHPRRTTALTTLTDAESFLEYVELHGTDATVVWCDFNPTAATLSFRAVIDEHSAVAAGWRAHQAVFKPAMSPEWLVWAGKNKQWQEQLAFAEFLEANELDIAAPEGMPTSADMMKMATNFEAKADMRFKSAIRLTDGGVKMEYINANDDATVEQMSMFSKFAIGIPVFWFGAAYAITARLKYRSQQAKASFAYELIRPDLVHSTAAKALIEKIKAGIAAVPMLMGAVSN